MRRIILTIAALVFALPAHATTVYKTFDLPDGQTLQPGDGISLSRAGTGSYHLTGTELTNSIFAAAPGTAGQIAFNSGGQLTTGSAASILTLLGVAPVATSGSYSSLTGLPALGSLAALNSISDSNWSGSALSLAHGGTGAVTQGAAQSALGLVPGTTVQGYSAELTSAAGISSTGYVKRTGTASWTAAAIQYTDLTGAPTIPTTTGQLTNNSGFITASGAPVQSVNGSSGAVTISATSLGLGNVQNIALSTWAGSSNLVTLGTLTAPFNINLNSAPLPTALTGTILQTAGANATAARIETDSYGASGFFTAVRADGTSASPTTLQAGDEIGGYNAWGYDGTSRAGPAASFRTYAAQNWTSSAHGTYADIAITLPNTIALSSVIRFESDGGITIPQTVTGGDKGPGTINVSSLYLNGLPVAPAAVPLDAETASFTLILADATKAVLMNSGSGNTLTVPPNASVPFVVGTQIVIYQTGAGQTTVLAGAGVTVSTASATAKLRTQYSGATLLKIGTDTWLLIGDLAAS